MVCDEPLRVAFSTIPQKKRYYQTKMALLCFLTRTLGFDGAHNGNCRVFMPVFGLILRAG